MHCTCGQHQGLLLLDDSSAVLRCHLSARPFAVVAMLTMSDAVIAAVCRTDYAARGACRWPRPAASVPRPPRATWALPCRCVPPSATFLVTVSGPLLPSAPQPPASTAERSTGAPHSQATVAGGAPPSTPASRPRWWPLPPPPVTSVCWHLPTPLNPWLLRPPCTGPAAPPALPYWRLKTAVRRPITYWHAQGLERRCWQPERWGPRLPGLQQQISNRQFSTAELPASLAWLLLCALICLHTMVD